MEIKEQIEEIVSRIKNDKTLGEDFKKDPVKAVEKILGIDLPDDVIQKVIDGVKAVLAGDKLGGALDKIKGLF